MLSKISEISQRVTLYGLLYMQNLKNLNSQKQRTDWQLPVWGPGGKQVTVV